MIESLKGISIEALFPTFKEAFIDYDVQINENELARMLNRRGFNPELSFGLYENGQLRSFILNGTGIFNNLKTAYDTGTGTLKEYRGKGYATEIFNYSLPFLKQAGITQYLLEVLQHNTNAVNLYRRSGFEVVREFNYFTQQVTSMKIPVKPLPSCYRLQDKSLNEVSKLEYFWDFTPSWQNNFQAISKKEDDFRIKGAFLDSEIVGYCIFEPASGDITQIAVQKEHRRQGIGTSLLREILKLNKQPSIKAINCEVSCTNITHFLDTFGIPVKGKQFEMIKQL